jgi:NACHT domain
MQYNSWDSSNMNVFRHRNEPDLCELLPSAAQAAFNAYDKRHDPCCLINTRVDVLKQIVEWADGGNERCIFWLNGMAGTGKSTIARTVARKYYEERRLGASFFFSRGAGDVSHAGKFFTSIAVQLASKSRALRRYICEAIAKHSDIARQSPRDQWYQLVLGPLSKLDGSSSPSYILVVDALDECDDKNDIRMIVQLLAEARSLRTGRLRVFMTSRPEIPIRHGFDKIQEAQRQDFILHNVSPTVIDHDISIFLEYNLQTIGQGRFADGWPGEQIVKRLVQNASGLFIWAATACLFIRGGGQFAEDRLSLILQSDGSVTEPEDELNKIYITVLENSVNPAFTKQEKEKFYERLRRILGAIVVLFSPLSAVSLARLFHTPKEKVSIDTMLEDLHAILNIPTERNRPIRLHHPSFRDFLLDKARCENRFWVDEKQAHEDLADHCVQLMSNTLKQDICGLQAPGTLAAGVDSGQVERCIPPEIQYACLYWVQHLQRSGTELYDNDQVHQFLGEHLLHWLEALGLMRRTSEGVLAISSLESHIQVSCLDSRLGNSH